MTFSVLQNANAASVGDPIKITDWIQAGVAVALLVVAALQLWLLLRQNAFAQRNTSESESQTSSMRRQEVLMDRALAEARESGAAQAAATARQLDIMRQQQRELSTQVRLDRKRFIATYPPSLVMTPPVVDESETAIDEDADTILPLRFTIVNNGMTDARDIRVCCSSYWAIDRQLPKGLTQSTIEVDSRLGPTRHADLTHISTDLGYMMALNDHSRDATSNVMLEVIAYFKDVTGRPHTATALFVYSTNAKVFMHAASGNPKVPRFGQ